MRKEIAIILIACGFLMQDTTLCVAGKYHQPVTEIYQNKEKSIFSSPLHPIERTICI